MEMFYLVLLLQLFLLQKLHFHLTVHSPFRPLSGLIIDIKVRSCPDHASVIVHPHPTPPGRVACVCADTHPKLPQSRPLEEGGRQVPSAQSAF